MDEFQTALCCISLVSAPLSSISCEILVFVFFIARVSECNSSGYKIPVAEKVESAKTGVNLCGAWLENGYVIYAQVHGCVYVYVVVCLYACTHLCVCLRICTEPCKHLAAALKLGLYPSRWKKVKDAFAPRSVCSMFKRVATKMSDGIIRYESGL